ncbi:MAG: hypothetical protein V5A68_01400 [Candidatus Thermoplasmatota archaeon]
MKKKIIVVTIVIILVSICFSGCVSTSEHNKNDNIEVYLESEVLEFNYIDIEKNKNINGELVNVTVKWLFHNLVNRVINVSISIDFYDSNKNLLLHKDRELNLLPGNYTEQVICPANTLVIQGKMASKIDYIVFKAVESP